MRRFQIVSFVPDSDAPGHRVQSQTPTSPTFVEGATAYLASTPACSLFHAPFGNMVMRECKPNEVMPRNAVMVKERHGFGVVSLCEQAPSASEKVQKKR